MEDSEDVTSPPEAPEPQAETSPAPSAVQIPLAPGFANPLDQPIRGRQVKAPPMDANGKVYPPGIDVNVIGPDGKRGSVRSEDLGEYMKRGYHTPSAQEQAVGDYLDQNEGLKGALKVASSKFGDEALLGIPGIIYDKTGDPYEVAKYEALKKEHETAKVIGSVGGFGASLLVGGPLFKAGSEAGELASKVVAKQLAAGGVEAGSESAAKSLVAKMATGATKLGVEGAVVSAPRAITETTLGDPMAGAESLLYGAGIGSFLGAAGGPLGAAFSKLSDGISTGDKSLLETLRDERAAKALGFTKSQIKKVGGEANAQEIGNYILNAKTPVVTDASGAITGGDSIISPLASTDDMLKGVTSLNEDAGQRIGAIHQTLDDAGIAKFNAGAVASDIEDKLGGFYRSPINKDISNMFDNVLESVKMRGAENISYADAQALKEEIQKVAYPGGKMPLVLSDKQELAQKALRIVTEHLNNAVDEGAEQAGKPGMLDDLLKARKDYSMSIKAKNALNDKLAGEAGNKLFGLTDTIVGAGALGNPVVGLATLAGKKVLEKYGNQIAANVLDKSVSGLLLAEQAMKSTAKKLDGIPAAIDSMMKPSSSAVSNIVPDSIGVMSRMMDTKPNADKEEMLRNLREKVSQVVSNPSHATNLVGKKVAGLAHGGAPNIADAMNNKVMGTFKYLDQNIPKPTAANNPFHPVDQKTSATELAAFERKLSVLENPMSVIDELKHGTLTKDHMDALSYNFPVIHQAIKSRITNHLLNNKAVIPYNKRLKMSLLMGSDIDGTTNPDSIIKYQNLFSKPMAQEHPPSATSMKGLGKLAQSTQTPLQQRMMRED